MKYNDKNVEIKVLKNVSILLSEKGARGWNMDELAQRSDIAKNTLYRVIQSKEEAIKKAVIMHIIAVQAELTKTMDTENNYMSALNKVLNQFPKLMNSIYSEYIQEVFEEYPSIESEIMERRNELTKRLNEFIKKGMDNREIRKDINPEILIELFQSVIISYIRKGYKGGEMELHLKAALDYIINGIK